MTNMTFNLTDANTTATVALSNDDILAASTLLGTGLLATVTLRSSLGHPVVIIIPI
jgi:hypothetical protein